MSRCNCAKSCDCYLFDDGYNGSGVVNNNSTFVRGVGQFFSPYSVDNIHDPNFIPPIAKARRNKSFQTQGKITFDGGADFNTEGMFNTNTPDRITITHDGLYAIGFDVAYELNFNTILAQFSYEATIRHNFISTSSFCEELKHSYFETTTIWPLTVRSTQSKIAPTFCATGDFFTLHTAFTQSLVNSVQATMWVCYI